MRETVTVRICGVDVDVAGDWSKYRPALITADPRRSVPPEGGCFEDGVSITIGGVDVGELFAEAEIKNTLTGKSQSLEHIVEDLAAEELAMERMSA